MTDVFGAINVPLAILWTEPGDKREHDRLILGTVTDPKGWADGMNDDMRLWLVGKVETQALFGERVVIIDRQGDWLQVAAAEQATERDPHGYPGWLPAVQVYSDTRFLREQAGFPSVAVTAPQTRLYRDDCATIALAELSYQSRLPLLAENELTFTVRLPSGDKGCLRRGDTVKSTEAAFSAADLLRQARLFLGLRYIWGGTSSYGFDCSGFVQRLYQSQGIRIPRDADEQAQAGISVSRQDLAPGDLLFFASDNGQGSIHHVGMYTADDSMIHAPNSRAAIKEESFATGIYAREYWGARRYR